MPYVGAISGRVDAFDRGRYFAANCSAARPSRSPGTPGRTPCASQSRYTLVPSAVLLSLPGACVSGTTSIISGAASGRRPFQLLRGNRHPSDSGVAVARRIIAGMSTAHLVHQKSQVHFSPCSSETMSKRNVMAPSQQTNRRRTAIVTLWSLLLSPGGLVGGPSVTTLTAAPGQAATAAKPAPAPSRQPESPTAPAGPTVDGNGRGGSRRRAAVSADRKDDGFAGRQHRQGHHQSRRSVLHVLSGRLVHGDSRGRTVGSDRHGAEGDLSRSRSARRRTT